MDEVQVRRVRPDDGIGSLLRSLWAGDEMVVHGSVFRVPDLPTLVAVEPAAGGGDAVVGLLTYDLRGAALEIVSCDSLQPGRGIGRALVEAAQEIARRAGAGEVVCTTTNDNLGALGFWQRLGFRLVGLRPGAVDAARLRKPSIPLVGEHGIEIHDELDLRWEPHAAERPPR